MRWWSILVMLTGCDLLFGMHEQQDDAGIALDAPHRDASPPTKDGPVPLAKSCKDALSHGVMTDGVVTIDPDGSGPALPFDVYCEMTTAGGGWTLVWSYGFTDYQSFNANDNAVTLIPSWGFQSSGAQVSTTIPTSPTVTNAMPFAQWGSIGSEFLVTSNINHWLDCMPGTGSLVTLANGSVTCTIVKLVATACTTTVPDGLIKNISGPALTAGGQGTRLYYFWDGSTSTGWPTHDPCGNNSPNQLTGVANPGGAIYVR